MFIVSYPLCAFDEHQTTTPAFQLQSTKTSLSTCGCTIRLAPAVATEVGTNHQMQHIAHVQQTVEAVYPSLRTNFLFFIQRCARGSTLANGRYWVFVLNWHDGAEKRQKSSVADVGSRNKDVVVFVGRVDFVPGVLGTRCSLLFASQTAVLLWVFFLLVCRRCWCCEQWPRARQSRWSGLGRWTGVPDLRRLGTLAGLCCVGEFKWPTSVGISAVRDGVRDARANRLEMSPPPCFRRCICQLVLPVVSSGPLT